ncbi:MAG: alpha/beta fold hydrolase, partial [Gammaproteobacteria bacterium]|nr:alpha/beta fold hydrolase [Gammaproteobacteria bacterium]
MTPGSAICSSECCRRAIGHSCAISPRWIRAVSLTSMVLVLVLAVSGGLWLFTRRVATNVETRIPVAGKFADVAGARLHYVQRGETRADQLPIVMLHGLAGHLHHFNFALVDELAKDTRVLAIDRPGSGYSTRDYGKVTKLTEQADAVIALLDQLGITRAVFVGHSLGGALSLTIAIRHPTRVAGLTLIAPLTHISDRLSPVFRGIAVKGRAARVLIAHLLATPMYIMNRQKIMPQIFGPESVPSGYVTRGGGLLTLRPSQYIGASGDLGAVHEIMPGIEARYEELNRPDAPPIDLLYGREDRIRDYR